MRPVWVGLGRGDARDAVGACRRGRRGAGGAARPARRGPAGTSSPSALPGGAVSAASAACRRERRAGPARSARRGRRDQRGAVGQTRLVRRLGLGEVAAGVDVERSRGRTRPRSMWSSRDLVPDVGAVDATRHARPPLLRKPPRPRALSGGFVVRRTRRWWTLWGSPAGRRGVRGPF